MEFIEELPKSERKDTILVFVNKFIKYRYFIALSHLFLAQDIAHIFLDYFYKFHGSPATIVIDRDKVFTSFLWKELFKR